MIFVDLYSDTQSGRQPYTQPRQQSSMPSRADDASPVVASPSFYHLYANRGLSARLGSTYTAESTSCDGLSTLPLRRSIHSRRSCTPSDVDTSRSDPDVENSNNGDGASYWLSTPAAVTPDALLWGNCRQPPYADSKLSLRRVTPTQHQNSRRNGVHEGVCDPQIGVSFQVEQTPFADDGHAAGATSVLRSKTLGCLQLQMFLEAELYFYPQPTSSLRLPGHRLRSVQFRKTGSLRRALSVHHRLPWRQFCHWHCQRHWWQAVRSIALTRRRRCRVGRLRGWIVTTFGIDRARKWFARLSGTHRCAVNTTFALVPALASLGTKQNDSQT
ncbi:hypothetical protein IWX90DRAFT_116670 [Phyllosticta citrichinensis]|uniref:Uncharacterized protein n=1 Tax=Phyllosticta citrichinensis TaxID=1130410 RepID=A0ABR1Y369_9PEZI